MILPPCFWTEEELQSIPSEDLWCEIADAMFCGLLVIRLMTSPFVIRIL